MDDLATVNAALADELISVNSIYGDTTLDLAGIPKDGSDIVCVLRLPSHADTALRLSFPLAYPDLPPEIVGTETFGGPRGEGKRLVELAQDVLANVHRPSEVCIFDFLEDLSTLLESEGVLHDQVEPEQNDHAEELAGSEQRQQLAAQLLGEEPPWSISEPIASKRSVFVARAAPVQSVEEASRFIMHLKDTNKKVASATHNITAWRIKRDNIVYQDYDDDGEDAAGGRLLHLLQLTDSWNVVVIVTRWYGGIHLGPDRFRLIGAVARDALVVGGFVKEKKKAG
ncbi:UPF0029-domain-containing protein [Eremomyces bilateralis CBS 781.70]|uniref:UPF0029-domain-containing protein n=1 Tax=Eremomyces bilateralis CBS 781.70 TaxID=1392243 RepID=A0A6G1FRB3_9PEZI|nr:UPF0029-domain-containing protein [Eremomyces bilateralis CBS 781.70]KAF1808221.1 UPF0029-domain-containing protein [Eremomyces bilateralis CBS 781.70]